MKRIFFVLAAVIMFAAAPALAAAAPSAWQPATPAGYTVINWAKAAGITSYFRAPENNGSLDFITRIYLPQNSIKAIISSTPLDAGPANPNFLSAGGNFNVDSTGTSSYRNLSFVRTGAEAAKSISSDIKFLWDAPFFNMQPTASDLSMALRYKAGVTTTITSGARSIPDMAQARRMLIVDNEAGKAMIRDFDSAAFLDEKNGDLAFEGFSPAVMLSDSASAAAARLFMGVTSDGKELVIYCSQKATPEEASKALLAAGVPLDRQLQADGGGSAACGYNLPGQFFVEPIRTLPVMLGAASVLPSGIVTAKVANVRSGPGTKNKIVSTLNNGAKFKVYEEKSGWYRIGEGQWVIKTLVKIK